MMKEHGHHHTIGWKGTIISALVTPDIVAENRAVEITDCEREKGVTKEFTAHINWDNDFEAPDIPVEVYLVDLTVNTDPALKPPTDGKPDKIVNMAWLSPRFFDKHDYDGDGYKDEKFGYVKNDKGEIQWALVMENTPPPPPPAPVAESKAKSD